MWKQPRRSARGKAIRNSLLALSGILSFSSATMRAQQRIDPYPLAVGNYWIYKGHVGQPALFQANGRMLPSKTVEKTWRSEITQIISRKDGPGSQAPASPSVVAAVFDNFPLCLPVFDQDRGRCLLIDVKSQKFYRILNYPDQLSEYLRNVQDPHGDLALRDAVPILDFPLTLGRQWGVKFDSWVVTQSEDVSLVDVRGASVSKREGFTVETGNNTGRSSFTFVPGIGITHVFMESLFGPGDPNHWEVEAKLIEVHLAQAK